MNAPPSPPVRLRGVVKRYGAITAVDGLDLDVPAGTCVGLLGPNGAGKSTTMKMLTAQVLADAGELRVLGYTLPAASKGARGEGGSAIERALEIAHLVDRRSSKVSELSGGMRRRLLIARALVHRPRLLL